MPLADDFYVQNVFDQTQDQDSILNLYRRLILLRRKTPALVIGSYRRVATEGDTLVFVRELGQEWVLVALNFSSSATAVDFHERLRGRVVLSLHGKRDGELMVGRIELAGNEGLVVALDLRGDAYGQPPHDQ